MQRSLTLESWGVLDSGTVLAPMIPALR